MVFKGRKVYGQSKDNLCAFCDNRALSENSQGLMVCKEHKNEVMQDTKCVCGEYLEIKKSKWGAFYLCKNCGPMNMKKGSEMDGDGYKLNKKYRDKKIKDKEKKIKYEKDRVYGISELEDMWD